MPISFSFSVAALVINLCIKILEGIKFAYFLGFVGIINGTSTSTILVFLFLPLLLEGDDDSLTGDGLVSFS